MSVTASNLSDSYAPMYSRHSSIYTLKTCIGTFLVLQPTFQHCHGIAVKIITRTSRKSVSAVGRSLIFVVFALKCQLLRLLGGPTVAAAAAAAATAATAAVDGGALSGFV